MKKQLTPALLIPGLLLCYDFLFWNEMPGINLVLFFLLLTAFFIYSFPQLRRNKTALILLLLSFIAVALVAVNNTPISMWTAITLLVITTGFVHQASFRSAPYALGYSLLRFSQSPGILWRAFRKLTSRSPQLDRMFRHHKLIYFPVLITVIFFVIYIIGDAQFATAFGNSLDEVFNFLSCLTDYFSIPHLLFLLLGTFLITAAMVPKTPSAIVESELKQTDELSRRGSKRTKVPRVPEPDHYPVSINSLSSSPHMLGLKSEYRRGVITLIFINLLLLCVNAVDVSKVWFEGQSDVLSTISMKSNSSLRSQAVHEGTNALIFSILMAMAVLLLFFRGNINFLKKNKLLLQLAYIWIIQNALLAITVGIRNYYYIDDCGLTMKRIGVFAFLIATVFGLVTFYFKIREKKSAYYLIRMNSWAVCAVFLLLSAIDWDPLMANYNINHLPHEKLDKQFLLWLSPHALPELIENKQIFINEGNTPEINSRKEGLLRNRIEDFIYNYENLSWKSSNYADYRVYNYLLTQKQISWTR